MITAPGPGLLPGPRAVFVRNACAAPGIRGARVMANLIRLPGDVFVTYVLLKTVERAILPLFARLRSR